MHSMGGGMDELVADDDVVTSLMLLFFLILRICGLPFLLQPFKKTTTTTQCPIVSHTSTLLLSKFLSRMLLRVVRSRSK